MYCKSGRSIFVLQFSFAPRLTIIFTTTQAAGERRPNEGMKNFCVKIINGYNGDDEEEIYFYNDGDEENDDK